MDTKPDSNRLIAGVTNTVVRFITLAVAIMIGSVVASQWHPRYGVYWMLTLFAVVIAITVAVGLLQIAWARYRGAAD